MRYRRNALLATAALAATCFAVPAVGQAAPHAPGSGNGRTAQLGQEDCQSGYICTWPGAYFQGGREQRPCKAGTPYPEASAFRSVKNECADLDAVAKEYLPHNWGEQESPAERCFRAGTSEGDVGVTPEASYEMVPAGTNPLCNRS